MLRPSASSLYGICYFQTDPLNFILEDNISYVYVRSGNTFLKYYSREMIICD